MMWKGTFGVIEQGVSALGLVTLCFVVAAVMLHPAWMDVGKGFLPTLPGHDRASYWFIAVSILGASITPYLFFFRKCNRLLRLSLLQPLLLYPCSCHL